MRPELAGACGSGASRWPGGAARGRAPADLARLRPLAPPASSSLLLAAAGLGLLRAALRRLQAARRPGRGVVVIDEARIAYLGPRQGGFVDLPAVTRVEIVTRPHLPQPRRTPG